MVRQGSKEISKQKTIMKFKKRSLAAIKAGNTRFKKLSLLGKRLAIARDVLAQLKIGSFVASSGYGHAVSVEHQTGLRSLLPYGDLQENLNNGVVCEGCAKAAVLISKARLANEVIVHNQSSQDMAHETSREIFGEECADVIEALYELDSGCLWRLNLSYDQRAAVYRTHERIYAVTDRETRMRLIYQNIVDNGGKLKVGRYKF
jgi:hypothetical protein